MCQQCNCSVLTRVFIKSPKGDPAFPLGLWPAEGGCHTILEQSMTYLETALEKVLDPGTDLGTSPTHCYLQTEPPQAGKQAKLSSLGQGGMLGIPEQYPKQMFLL